MRHLHSEPLKKPFFTPGTFVLMIFMAIGFAFGISRLFTGLETVTNLNDSYPWGIWIAIDVACGVALAAGGFTTAALVDIFGGKKYHALLRPAVLTAWLGYIMVAVGLMFDLGRYWNIWQPMFNWQGNSVMFELAMCVMAYLIVLTFEMAPAILEGLKERINTNEWGSKVLAKFEKPIIKIHSLVKIILPIFIVAGVVLSCMHQSSLGTLMVIAPTKLNALWYSAWLPLFFLMSAIMVGFPMVVIESLSSSKGLKREAEMDILAPLAAKIPWFIAVYFLFRLGDLLARVDQLNFWEHPADTVSFAIEIIGGLIVPFALLSIKSMRRSRGWLLTACALIVFGVALNRINVFLVGYHPHFATEAYFPSLGEIFLTVGLVSTLILLYRFFVNYFPILPQLVETSPSEPDEEFVEPVQPVTAWIVRGSAAVFLLLFIVLYVTVHKQAIAESALIYGEVYAVAKTDNGNGNHPSPSHAFRPEKYRNFYFLNSPILNSKADYYESVRFSHRSHDNYVGGDCSICHHRVSDGDEDRIGEDIKELHASIEVRIGGACIRCHEDLNEKQFQKCGDCHMASNEPDYPARIGLKGAYHRQCISCHAKEPAFAGEADDCISCHHPITPDHKELMTGDASLNPQQLTAQCLSCHPRVGKDILATAHWNWKGLTPDIEGHEHSATTGLLKVMDNYTITARPELVPSSSFHIGYNPEESTIDFNNMENIDCFVCHDTTATYKKDPSKGGMPTSGLNMQSIANSVGRPSRQNCGSCHFYAGGGANVKHGDLEPVLVDPPSEIDVHMGMADMICQDCHQSRNHQIPGMSFMAPVTEGRVYCETCHSNQPHGITGFLSKHLDDHVRAVSCEACHIPYFAKETATRLSTDFSTAGKDRPINTDELGMPDYDKRFGSLTWGKEVVPTYRWFDGTRKTYVLGDRLESTDMVELNAPLGEKHIPDSRIFPFKVHNGVQPYDKENKTLAAVKFKNGFLDHFNWDRAIKEGMDAVGLKYSGQYGFVKTRMYSSIHHEVVPAKQALGCTDCHQVEAISCKRCHKKAVGMDQPSHTQMVYPHMKNRFDFKALGYEDDPAFMGGRFYIKLGRGKPPE
jgi:octaheme c-type cytochrome (tetrathionate reductase family)